MQTFDYVIIGGGPAGVGALETLEEVGVSSVILLEGRATLGYTLGWMTHLAFPESTDTDSASLTGSQFLERYLRPHETHNDKVRLRSRAFSVDLTARSVDVITGDKSHERLAFNHLILAQGAVQVLFGRYLLPGKRTNRMFTSYQAGEMMAHYPFLPGNRLIFFGESPYTIETALAAKELGIASAIVNPSSFEAQYRGSLPDVPLYEDARLNALSGDAVFTGLEIEQNGNARHIDGDALVVDGDFVLERQWRDMLNINLDLESRRTVVPASHPAGDRFTLVGDAAEPDPNFVRQYERAREAVRKITAYTQAG